MACVRDSKISMTEAESKVLELLEEHTLPKECPLTGSSVHLYQPFLEAYMPRLFNHLSPHSIVDVGTIRTLSWDWCWRNVRYFERKDRTFRSLNDILEDIRELKHFREILFTPQRETAMKMFRAACMARCLSPYSSVFSH